LPGASSFIQVQGKEAARKARALEMIRVSQQKHPHTLKLDLVGLALHGKKIGLDKVITMIDEMVAILKQEQTDDANKKEYCTVQMDSLDDKRKGLLVANSNSEKAIADGKENIETLTSDVAALEDGIKGLDKQVAEASAQRKAENADFKNLMAQNTAAKELLGLAKTRLNKFYNPKLPSLAALREAPAPPPEAPGAYSKKSEEGNGIIAMLDELAADLDKEMTVAQAEEKNSQADYERTMADAADKRAEDSKTISDKNSAKADAEESVQQNSDALSSGKKELAATLETIQALHGECDWLIKYYDFRTEARTSEIDALGKAKAVLNGADFA